MAAHFSIFRPANLCVRAGSGGVGTGARHECPGTRGEMMFV